MKAFFLVAVVLLVLLAAFAIANAVFSSENSQSNFDSSAINTSLEGGAGTVGNKMNDANDAADEFATNADNAAIAAQPTFSPGF